MDFLGINAEREENGFPKRSELISLGGLGLLKEGNVLKRVAVNILSGERFIHLTIIGEFDNLNIQSLFGSDLFGFFSDFSVRSGQCSKLDRLLSRG